METTSKPESLEVFGAVLLTPSETSEDGYNFYPDYAF
jgi:hypothetical protein